MTSLARRPGDSTFAGIAITPAAVLDETQEEKARYEKERAELGQRIRAVRLERKASLRELGNAARVSESFLSQVERGLTSPSVLTLRRIAVALDVHIVDLLAGEDTGGHLIRVKDRGRYKDPRHQWADEFLTPRSARKLQVNLTEIKPGQGIPEPYTHDSDEECVIVLLGKLHVTANGSSYALDEGDALLINPRLPHSFMNPGPGQSRVLWVMTPPSW
jgi:transcriptional regulator with XRE-family HTH domain